jgi:hypothetical protein
MERCDERMGVAGTGAKFVRLGKSVRYRECDLVAWSRLGLSVQQAKKPRNVALSPHSWKAGLSRQRGVRETKKQVIVNFKSGSPSGIHNK